MSAPVPDPAPAPADSARETLLLGVIDRLDGLVASETAALRALRPIDTTPFATQKSQALLELARLMRHTDAETAASARVRGRMEVLRARLDENRAALELHLNAARQVFDTVSKAMNDAESDRTYSATPSRRKTPQP